MVQKYSRIKVYMYNALAVPILQYVSKIWALKQKDKKLMTSIERKVFRTAGFALFDTKKNEEIFGSVGSTTG